MEIVIYRSSLFLEQRQQEAVFASTSSAGAEFSSTSHAGTHGTILATAKMDTG
jgi:hypothetical protein